MDKAEGYDLEEVKLLDQSFCRVVLGFWLSALVWMFMSGTLGYIISVKLYRPDYLTHFFGLELGWLTYGRLFSVWQATTLFGWAGSMMLGISVWLMGRITGQNLQGRLTVGASNLLWQLGVVLGVYVVLSGGNRGNTLLGLPYQGVLICFIGALLWSWSLVRLAIKSEKSFIAKDYILGSAFCLVWVLSTALVFSSKPISGVVSGLLQNWASHGFVYLFLIPMGIATVYYLVPALLNKPLRFYGLARIGFWTWFFFACWSGTQGLTGAPLPVWLVGVGATSAILLLLPIAVVALNLLGTLQAELETFHKVPILHFVAISLVFLVVGGFTHVVMGIANWNGVVNLTYFPLGQLMVWVLGFVTFVSLGTLYYGLPYLTRCHPASVRLTYLHFWTAFYGTAAFVVLMLVSGIVQGVALKNPDLDFNQVINDGLPYFRGRVVAFSILLIAAIAFALNLVKMVLGDFSFKKVFQKNEAKELA